MEFIHAFIGEVASGEQSLDVAAGKIFLSRTTCTVRVWCFQFHYLCTSGIKSGKGRKIIGAWAYPGDSEQQQG